MSTVSNEHVLKDDEDDEDKDDEDDDDNSLSSVSVSAQLNGRGHSFVLVLRQSPQLQQCPRLCLPSLSSAGAPPSLPPPQSEPLV